MRRQYVLNGAPVSLQAFLAENEFSPEETKAIRALRPGDTYTGGGGASPEWTLRCEAKGRKLPSPPITDRPEWGLKPQGEYCAAWGARAIWDPPFEHGGPRVLSFLWDRKAAVGPDDDLKALFRWLDDTGIKAMQKRLHAEDVQPSDYRELVIEGGPRKRFSLRANPNQSCGYVYLSAVVKAEPLTVEQADMHEKCQVCQRPVPRNTEPVTVSGTYAGWTYVWVEGACLLLSVRCEAHPVDLNGTIEEGQ